MNNLISDLTSMNGRINRQRWWIGVIVLIVIGIIVAWILGMILGTTNIGALVNADGTVNQNAVNALTTKAGWQGLITSIIFAYPQLALNLKRRHDRNNNGYDAIALVALSILYQLLAALGITVSLGIVGAIVGIIFVVLAIWLLVQCGFLRGTAGPNSYGPDPLGG
jgi:uncharacterized membrane protein YhaH (DUF805 family)